MFANSSEARSVWPNLVGQRVSKQPAPFTLRAATTDDLGSYLVPLLTYLRMDT